MDKKHRTSKYLVQVGPVTNEAILWKYYTNVLSNQTNWIKSCFKGGFVVENARIVEYIPIFYCY